MFWQLDNFMDIQYLELDENDLQTNIVFRTLERWGTWLLIYTNFVPISLLVTLEMVLMNMTYSIGQIFTRYHD